MRLWRAACCLSQKLDDLGAINEAVLLFAQGAKCAQCCADGHAECFSFAILF